MAACGTSNHIIFDKPTHLFDNSLSETSPSPSIQSQRSFEESYFTDILSDVESLSSTASSASSYADSSYQKAIDTNYSLCNRTSHRYTQIKSFSSSSSTMKTESLQLCTEGLGFESSDEIEESSVGSDWEHELERIRSGVVKNQIEENPCESRIMSRKIGFPPPIPSLGKPWMCFRSYKRDGRFVLKEVRVPIQDMLHASRGDGRLKLQLVHSDDENFDEGIEERNDLHCDCVVNKADDDGDNGEIGRENKG